MIIFSDFRDPILNSRDPNRVLGSLKRLKKTLLYRIDKTHLWI